MDQSTIDHLGAKPVTAAAMLVDGHDVLAADGTTLDVVSPIDGATLTQLPDATEADVGRAVDAARKSFEAGVWSKMPPAARKKVLLKWAELIEARTLELAVLGVRDNGTEISMALKAEPSSAVGTIRYYAEAIDKVYGEIAPTASGTLGLIHREPVGVVGAIVPWNFPMMIGAWKIAPALAAGNSVVLKPAETASLSLIEMVRLAHEAGLPDGVLNIVTGTGHGAGQALARSPDVDVLVFTGSGNVGRKLLEYSAQSNLKRVFLELGGKSPHIVFDDCDDLDAAAEAVVGGIFRNAGQVCVAGSRLLVHATIHDRFIYAVKTKAEALRVGNPLRLDTQVGALNSRGHMETVLGMIEGAKSIVTGGGQVLTGTGGNYMAPTIITDVAAADDLFTREVFGPVLTVTTFDNEAEAVRLANATDLGLAAGVWTPNLSRAHRMVGAIRAGVVHVNTYGGADGTVPLGGYKQSGNGHDKSLHAIDKFINTKTAWIKL